MTFAEFNPCMVIVILSDEVVKIKLLELSLDRYLLSVVSGNRYLLRGSKQNVRSTIFGICYNSLKSVNKVVRETCEVATIDRMEIKLSANYRSWSN